MSWTHRKKNAQKPANENSDDERSWAMWNVAESIEEFRESIKENGLSSRKVDWAMIKLSGVAIMSGTPKRAAPLLMGFLKKRKSEGVALWSFESHEAGMIGIWPLRLAAAYLENPSVSISNAEMGAQLFLDSVANFDLCNSLRQLVPGILAVRTHRNLRGAATVKTRSGIPLRSDIAESGMCAAAHRQWQVEYLLASGMEQQAIELAHRGRNEATCGSACSFAPHSMYASLLEPLCRAGRTEEAMELDARLELLLQILPTYLDAMGCRIHFAGLQGNFAKAGQLLNSMIGEAMNQDASDWQRFKFFKNCHRTIAMADENGIAADWLATRVRTPEEIMETVQREHQSLQEAYDNRKL